MSCILSKQVLEKLRQMQLIGSDESGSSGVSSYNDDVYESPEPNPAGNLSHTCVDDEDWC